MRRTVRLEGEIVEQQTLLDGTRDLTIEAAGAERPSVDNWQSTLTLRWPKEPGGEEGDLTLTDPAGASLYASLTDGSLEEDFDEDTASEVVRLSSIFEVHSGDGAFAGATGSVNLSGTLAGESVSLVADLDIAVAGA